MAKSQLRVSAIVPCFNGGEFLAEAVESIRAQKGSFVLDEVIVVDDRSTDSHTLNVLETLRSIDGIRVCQNVRNKGPGGARNTGIEEASSDWVIFLDADDVLQEGSIEARCKAVDEFPSAEWLGADFTIWFGGDHEEGASFFASRPMPKKILAESLSRAEPMLLHRPVQQFIDCALTHSAAGLFRRSMLLRTGGFDEHLEWMEDHHYWIRLAVEHDFVFVPQSVFRYRQHPTSTTRRDFPPRYWASKAYRALLNDPQFHAHASQIRSRLSDFSLEDAHYFRKNRMWAKSAAALAASIKCRPRQGDAYWSAVASIARFFAGAVR